MYPSSSLRVSAIQDDVLILRGTYGPSERDRTHEHKVRGRVVYRTKLKTATVSHTYRYVQFADSGLWDCVREDNITSKARAEQAWTLIRHSR